MSLVSATERPLGWEKEDCSKAPGFGKDECGSSKHGERLSKSSPCSINDQGTGSPQSLSNTGAEGKEDYGQELGNG